MRVCVQSSLSHWTQSSLPLLRGHQHEQVGLGKVDYSHGFYYADTYPDLGGNKCVDLCDKRRCDAIFRGPSAATCLAAVWIGFYCDDLLLVSTDPQAILDLLDKALRQVAVVSISVALGVHPLGCSQTCLWVGALPPSSD